MEKAQRNNDDLFFASSPAELAEGIKTDEGGTHVCLICYERFENGRIHEVDGELYDAARAVKEHIRVKHGSTAMWLSGLNKRLTGLTDIQRTLLECMQAGLDDKETAAKMNITPSTVRNHRFQMRERERQARVFLALMMLLEKTPANRKPQEEFMEVKRSAVMVDERYVITQEEYDDIIRKYFPDGPEGRLTEFPVKEKRKMAILTNLVNRFKPDIRYTEKQITEILVTAHPDHATLRRYLIEYGFMDRERDCSAYWLKQ